MICYKGFNQNLCCTMGRGTMQYEVGKTYTAESAKTANTGLHCVEEPIEVLRWYPDGRYCIVAAEGDINESDDKIACTQMRILKEINKKTLAMLQCEWMMEHPDRKYSDKVKKDIGAADPGDIVVVYGRSPKAQGGIGSLICMVKKGRNGFTAGAYMIDGKRYKPDVYYRVDGRRAR